MALVHRIKESFQRAKDDVEGVKNELAFALKRIARIEEMLNKQTIEKLSHPVKKSKTQRIKRKIVEY
jgi:hypothetical protein